MVKTEEQIAAEKEILRNEIGSSGASDFIALAFYEDDTLLMGYKQTTRNLSGRVQHFKRVVYLRPVGKGYAIVWNMIAE